MIPRAGFRFAAGLGLLAAGIWACARDAPEGDVASGDTGGDGSPTHLELVVERVGDSLHILSARPATPDPHRVHATEPRLTTDSASRHPAGADELQASVHAADGSLIATHGFGAAMAFGEQSHPSRPGLHGGATEPERDHRILHVPLGDGASHVAVHAAEVVDAATEPPNAVGESDGTRHLVSRPLAAVPVTESADAPSVSLEHPLDPEEPRVSLGVNVAPAAATGQPSPPTGGQLQGHTQYHVSGDPADSYDIVILGDGFGLGEVAQFDKLARAFSDYFLTYSPFDSLRDHINIYIVSALSVQSGISMCSRGEMIETFYGVQGCFQLTPGDTTYQAYCGSHEPRRLFDAAATAIPNANTDLFFVIANCAEYQGGSAFPPMKTAYATVGACRQKFLDIAVHECAHVIGRLADEYIGGAPDDGSDQPNLVRQAHVDAGNVWWKRLARPDELTASGEFRYQSRCGDDFWPVRTCERNNPCPSLCDFDCSPGIPCAPCDPKLAGGDGYPQDGDKLGLFWGCQFIDSTRVNDPPVYDCGLMDERGCGYYRGSPRCKMRFEDYAFCRVCADVLTRAVLGS